MFSHKLSSFLNMHKGESNCVCMTIAVITCSALAIATYASHFSYLNDITDNASYNPTNMTIINSEAINVGKYCDGNSEGNCFDGNVTYIQLISNYSCSYDGGYITTGVKQTAKNYMDQYYPIGKTQLLQTKIVQNVDQYGQQYYELSCQRDPHNIDSDYNNFLGCLISLCVLAPISICICICFLVFGENCDRNQSCECCKCCI